MRATPGSCRLAEIYFLWSTHNEDWVMAYSVAGVSACPVNYAPECEVARGSARLPLVGAGGDCIEHVGRVRHKRCANGEIAFGAAKVRRPLLSVDSLV